jgi:hypothetical protein
MSIAKGQKPEMLLGCQLQIKGFGKGVVVSHSGGGLGGAEGAGKRRYSLYKKATVKHTVEFGRGQPGSAGGKIMDFDFSREDLSWQVSMLE